MATETASDNRAEEGLCVPPREHCAWGHLHLKWVVCHSKEVTSFLGNQVEPFLPQVSPIVFPSSQPLLPVFWGECFAELTHSWGMWQCLRLWLQCNGEWPICSFFWTTHDWMCLRSAEGLQLWLAVLFHLEVSRTTLLHCHFNSDLSGHSSSIRLDPFQLLFSSTTCSVFFSVIYQVKNTGEFGSGLFLPFSLRIHWGLVFLPQITGNADKWTCQCYCRGENISACDVFFSWDSGLCSDSAALKLQITNAIKEMHTFWGLLDQKQLDLTHVLSL